MKTKSFTWAQTSPIDPSQHRWELVDDPTWVIVQNDEGFHLHHIFAPVGTFDTLQEAQDAVKTTLTDQHGGTPTLLTPDDIVVGKTYRAKHPVVNNITGEHNDRTIVWKGITQVQYDGPTVKLGQKLPRVDIEKFLKWADKEVK